ncbi:unnamed protein product [marine sediment metagenome]|uniref:HAD family hydrolase n=1 Tax=marine sediment metagenome TaxID=412755 RepID=X1T864_9ZZZZ
MEGREERVNRQNSMKYEAVIFDLGGTLVHNSYWSEGDNALRRMASVLAVPPDDFVTSWHATFEERMTGIFQSYQACIRHICQQLGVDVQDDQIESAARIRSDYTKREITTTQEGAIEVLSYLKLNGYKTGLISDCSAETPTIWKSTPLAPLINVAVFSCEVGLKKPDPRIYQIAIEKLAISPEKCIYIADGIGQELLSASQLGMYAIQIRVPGEYDDPYREEWSGPVISSLKDVLTLV